MKLSKMYTDYKLFCCISVSLSTLDCVGHIFTVLYSLNKPFIIIRPWGRETEYVYKVAQVTVFLYYLYKSVNKLYSSREAFTKKKRKKTWYICQTQGGGGLAHRVACPNYLIW